MRIWRSHSSKSSNRCSLPRSTLRFSLSTKLPLDWLKSAAGKVAKISFASFPRTQPTLFVPSSGRGAVGACAFPQAAAHFRLASRNLVAELDQGPTRLIMECPLWVISGHWSLSAEISSDRGLHRVGLDKENCVLDPMDSAKCPGNRTLAHARHRPETLWHYGFSPLHSANVGSLNGVTAGLQSSLPKSRAIAQKRVPQCEIS